MLQILYIILCSNTALPLLDANGALLYEKTFRRPWACHIIRLDFPIFVSHGAILYYTWAYKICFKNNPGFMFE